LLEDGGIYYVDPPFFKIFSFDFKEGKPETALAGLNDVVLTERVQKNISARKIRWEGRCTTMAKIIS